MDPGAFSVSLAIQDLEASKSFYESLGFTVRGEDASQNWLMLRNEATTIGLFQGVELQNQADEGTSGPASLIVVDPDGNPVLIDQHV